MTYYYRFHCSKIIRFSLVTADIFLLFAFSRIVSDAILLLHASVMPPNRVKTDACLAASCRLFPKLYQYNGTDHVITFRQINVPTVSNKNKKNHFFFFCFKTYDMFRIMAGLG